MMKWLLGLLIGFLVANSSMAMMRGSPSSSGNPCNPLLEGYSEYTPATNFAPDQVNIDTEINDVEYNDFYNEQKEIAKQAAARHMQGVPPAGMLVEEDVAGPSGVGAEAAQAQVGAGIAEPMRPVRDWAPGEFEHERDEAMREFQDGRRLYFDEETLTLVSEAEIRERNGGPIPSTVKFINKKPFVFFRVWRYSYDNNLDMLHGPVNTQSRLLRFFGLEWGWLDRNSMGKVLAKHLKRR